MMVLVIGQKGDGPIMQRLVTLEDFNRSWGRFAPYLLRKHRVEIDGCRVAVKVIR